jgi:hypothetical protein
MTGRPSKKPATKRVAAAARMNDLKRMRAQPSTELNCCGWCGRDIPEDHADQATNVNLAARAAKVGVPVEFFEGIPKTHLSISFRWKTTRPPASCQQCGLALHLRNAYGQITEKLNPVLWPSRLGTALSHEGGQLLWTMLPANVRELWKTAGEVHGWKLSSITTTRDVRCEDGRKISVPSVEAFKKACAADFDTQCSHCRTSLAPEEIHYEALGKNQSSLWFLADGRNEQAPRQIERTETPFGYTCCVRVGVRSGKFVYSVCAYCLSNPGTVHFTSPKVPHDLLYRNGGFHPPTVQNFGEYSPLRAVSQEVSERTMIAFHDSRKRSRYPLYQLVHPDRNVGLQVIDLEPNNVDAGGRVTIHHQLFNDYVRTWTQRRGDLGTYFAEIGAQKNGFTLHILSDPLYVDSPALLQNRSPGEEALAVTTHLGEPDLCVVPLREVNENLISTR